MLMLSLIQNFLALKQRNVYYECKLLQNNKELQKSFDWNYSPYKSTNLRSSMERNILKLIQNL